MELFSRQNIAGNSFQIDSLKKSNQIIISKTIANSLKITIDDELLTVFMNSKGRELKRKFKVAGIYNSGLAGDNFDSKIVLVDIAHIQKLNKWNNDQVGGFEVILNKYERLR